MSKIFLPNKFWKLKDEIDEYMEYYQAFLMVKES